MTMTKTKREKKRPTSSKMVIGFMTIFIFVVFLNLNSRLKDYVELETQCAEISARLEEEKSKSIQLEAKEGYYSSDAYIEKLAREEWGLIKPNEILFVNRSDQK